MSYQLEIAFSDALDPVPSVGLCPLPSPAPDDVPFSGGLEPVRWSEVDQTYGWVAVRWRKRRGEVQRAGKALTARLPLATYRAKEKLRLEACELAGIGGPGAAAPGLSSLRVIGAPREKPARTVWPSADAVKSEKWRGILSRMSKCRTEQLHLVMKGVNGDVTATAWASCNIRWHCDRDSVKVIRRIKTLRPKGLLTLTWRYNRGEPKDRVLLEMWNHFDRMKDGMRDAGGPIGRYVAVVEPHKTGAPHMHIVTEHWPKEWGVLKWMKRKSGWKRVLLVEHLYKLVRGEEQKTRLKDLWASITGGAFQVTWEELESDGTYISKYLTKAQCWPEDAKAFMSCNGIRIWNDSHKMEPDCVCSCSALCKWEHIHPDWLPWARLFHRPAITKSAWKWYRGSLREVEEKMDADALRCKL